MIAAGPIAAMPIASGPAGLLPVYGVKSNYLENEVLDHVLGGVDYPRPTTVYIGLWSATLDDTSDGSTVGEVSGNGYARAVVTNDSTKWATASSGTKSNGSRIQFPPSTGSWGIPTYWAICDAPSGGNILFFGALSFPDTLPSGYVFSFAADSLVLSEE
jgi:hypothetical protein